MLKSSLLAADGGHGGANDPRLGGIFIAVEPCGDVILRDGRHPASDGIRLNRGVGVGKVVKVIDDCFRLRRQGDNVMVIAPVGEITPIGAVGLDRIGRFSALQPPLALARKSLIVCDESVFFQVRIALITHVRPPPPFFIL